MVLHTGRDVACFTDPGTRMLLAGGGLTTPVLEALLGTRLQVRVLRQDLVPVTDVPGEVAALLGLGGGGEALVRRSCLVDPELSPVSLNQVIAATSAAGGRLYDDITSLDTPIGYSLIGRHLPQRREILHVGRSTWWHGGVARPCAVKAYVMLIDDEPWCYIRECYNPRHVPSAVTTVPVPPAREWIDTGADARRRPERNGSAASAGPAPVPTDTGRVAAHQPPWPDHAQVEASLGRLRELPPLVSPDECRTLTTELARTVTGDAFVLQLGDCAETFAGCTPGRIQARQALLTVGAAILGFGTGRPVVALGRIAGQYAKPRSRPTEPDAGASSGAEILSAYFHASATLNYLRAHPNPSSRAIEEITETSVRALRQNGGLPARPSGEYEPGTATDLIGEIGHLLAAALEAPPRSRCLHTLVPSIYTSHEALILPYEEALTRRTAAGDWWDSSAHLLWLGHRTRDVRQAHVAFAARIRNPIAVKLGPSACPEEVAALCSMLNPHKIPGRLTLITRLGAARVGELLPPLVQAAATVPVTWVCDPMHGNTRTTEEGRKFRRLEDITEEIRAFFRVHRDLGTVAGGVHLEAAGEDVTECTGGWRRISENGLGANYQTLCDPRLNPAQTLECLIVVLHELREQAMARKDDGEGRALRINTNGWPTPNDH
ncbi:3-deoxy-7-phosphoheptulonate synthase [Actinomadura rudentiformis]|uniref:Phospho-2-dehydro-3-deoxyheptonate aldolase n=1 Tax=Actinomadura rudentiformis TaxID=359158 RepID=A0A6H9Z9H8_9ACTN|nr:3-deoxy-7-phosphoheptulonate synthase [Actinomadura rudentiformis]KAB2352335.1 3-deoxy-7-phosphoheptulonate synthase [Actinomadura rudentiformis]